MARDEKRKKKSKSINYATQRRGAINAHYMQKCARRDNELMDGINCADGNYSRPGDNARRCTLPLYIVQRGFQKKHKRDYIR